MEKKTKKTKKTKSTETVKTTKKAKLKKVAKTSKKELTAKTRKKIVGGHPCIPCHCNIRNDASIEICPRELIDILRLSEYRGCYSCEKNPLNK